MEQISEQVRALLKGAYDLHLHAAPSPFRRALDDFELLQEAGEAGMAGIVLKSHYESTAARAELVNRHGGFSARAYGGIALNCPVGGLNPHAVENALKRGAKIVWMPTRDAQNSLSAGDMPGDFFKREGISVLDGQGGLRPEVLEILDIVKGCGAALATGHLSPEESALLCREGTARGVRMVLTHPEFDRTWMDAAAQRELAERGVYVEKCWYNIAEGNCTAREMARNIRTVGPEHCFLSSDRGQYNREHPAEGMRLFLAALLEEGISPEALYTMTHTVPAQVLGLEN
ncbi:MAG: hypothetical protein HFF52_02485 [Lawsonibacter sp.]|nr:hypothetical protein [Lawsonibacter sp.]